MKDDVVALLKIIWMLSQFPLEILDWENENKWYKEIQELANILEYSDPEFYRKMANKYYSFYSSHNLS